ncbi:YrdB family protein [Zhihengliuella halotolerans]|uniref:Uncharacterized protein DUF2568 n=1 Tax=Zhihengliuella halotolerans TaxID=370736 RepID=A0A4Q8ABZ6_9MICC|nr:YrdB family protein [Zhihengliuella halotolerans]RZU61710.1 uncharacterized protein DUF2568 [Zhihengliuella halotolerans]
MTKTVNALAFLLEVALIGAIVMCAMAVWDLEPVTALAVAGLPAAILTAVFLTSTSKFRLRWPLRPLLAHMLFVAGAAALIGLGHLTFGWIFLALALVSVGLTWRLRATLNAPAKKQRGAQEDGGAGATIPQPSGRRAAR